jgi:hypothetical protein
MSATTFHERASSNLSVVTAIPELNPHICLFKTEFPISISPSRGTEAACRPTLGTASSAADVAVSKQRAPLSDRMIKKSGTANREGGEWKGIGCQSCVGCVRDGRMRTAGSNWTRCWKEYANTRLTWTEQSGVKCTVNRRETDDRLSFYTITILLLSIRFSNATVTKTVCKFRKKWMILLC